MNNKIKKLKQIAAIAAVAIILLLYITTFTLSLMNNSYTDKFFSASLFATFFVPTMLYLIFWIKKLFSKKESDTKSDSSGSSNSHFPKF